MEAGFQRARRPEQVAERRTAILAVARDLLAQRRVTEISLRDLSAEVGLAKSNVLRYFDSREGIFLELLKVEWSAWLEALEEPPPAPNGGSPADGLVPPLAVAGTLARSLADRPLLCELFSSLGVVLEQNISIEYALEFKTWSRELQLKLRSWLIDRLSGLDDRSALTFATAVVILAGSLWPFARPSDNLVEAARQLGEQDKESFEEYLRMSLSAHLVGTMVLADSAQGENSSQVNPP
ncbi:TetR/AcrR family transcriptional regulator [Amycolatopsis pithecellobii]|uniref:TetR family transcriptional regulator n=1 Tax=Amycolatopsis pithecellobii TaxID=664692 RepID=A0A6N7Z7P7_9PSEU|nr:TetR family transcriptional regulator [Amycolatopsis pithecellobii]MTD57304.1 TetR family transcriptional regulator [Amycolatopsis pithecellobii]